MQSSGNFHPQFRHKWLCVNTAEALVWRETKADTSIQRLQIMDTFIHAVCFICFSHAGHNEDFRSQEEGEKSSSQS